ncbi:MAG: NUDIX domain-containing protein [Paracoccaceae bacterium]
MRAQIRAEIAGIVPFDVREAQILCAVLEWVDSGADLFRRVKPAVPPRHLVSYFCVVTAGQVLLGDHRGAGLWLPCGGHVEPGEHPRKTVQRECLEELRAPARFLTPSPVFLTMTRTRGDVASQHEDVSLWYILTAESGEVFDFDQGEYSDLRWFDWHDIPTRRTDPELPRFLTKLAASGLV